VIQAAPRSLAVHHIRDWPVRRNPVRRAVGGPGCDPAQGARTRPRSSGLFAAFARSANGGLIVTAGPLSVLHRDLIIRSSRLPRGTNCPRSTSNASLQRPADWSRTGRILSMRPGKRLATSIASSGVIEESHGHWVAPSSTALRTHGWLAAFRLGARCAQGIGLRIRRP
jgi:hypothetical protein